MAFATGARTQLRYIPESAYGTTPGSGNCVNLRRVDDTLEFQTTSEASAEVRSDRQVSDTALLAASASGAINGELSYREYDPFIAAALQSTFADYGTAGVGATFTATFAANTITASVAPTGTSAFTTLKKGQGVLVKVAGGGANNMVYATVSHTVSPTATVVTFEGSPFSVQAGVANTTLNTSYLENGVLQSSFSIEREHNDIDRFLLFKGMVVDSMNVSLQTAAKALISFEFMGSTQVVDDDTGLPGTPVASKTFDIMNTSSGIGSLNIGGSVANCFLQSLDLTVSNNLRGRQGLGVLGYCDIGSGEIAVTGSFTAYFSDTTAYEAFLSQSRVGISFLVKDAAGNGYMFNAPSCKYTSSRIVAGDKDSDSVVEFEFQALMSPVLGKTLIISRVGV